MSTRNLQFGHYGQISGRVTDAAISDDTVASLTSPKFREGRLNYVGQRVEFDDGRCFVYCSTKVDLRAGQLVAQRILNSGAVTANTGNTASAGATEITLNTNGVDLFGDGAGIIAAGSLAGGYLHFAEDTGDSPALQGFLYRIKDNTAGTASADITVTLFDPLKAASAADHEFVLIHPKYRKVIVGTATLPPVGVACVPTTAGTDLNEQYFWAQYRGPASVEGITTSLTIGENCAAGAGGRVADVAAVEDSTLLVGIVIGMDSAATGDCFAVDLRYLG